jgi:urease accessory protein
MDCRNADASDSACVTKLADAEQAPGLAVALHPTATIYDDAHAERSHPARRANATPNIESPPFLRRAMNIDPEPASLPLLRLLQLASPTLPVGAYSYSQGMEWSVAQGTVRDAPTAAAWIEDVLRFCIAAFELPCLARMLAAAKLCDKNDLHRLNSVFLAARESAELRAETVQMGRSLVRLMNELSETRSQAELLQDTNEPSYPFAWACAAAAFGLPAEQCRVAYAWSWLENQVLAAVKLVPLGQSAGQRMLLELSRVVSEVCGDPETDETQWTNFAPGFGIACSAHETQYTRLFRS